MKTIPFQQDLRPEVRTVFGNVDYLKFEKELRRIDSLINSSEIERVFVERSVARYKAEALADGIAVKKGHLANHEKHSIRALRCLARTFHQASYCEAQYAAFYETSALFSTSTYFNMSSPEKNAFSLVNYHILRLSLRSLMKCSG